LTAVCVGDFRVWREYGASGVRTDTGKTSSTHLRVLTAAASTGVERKSDEPVGQTLGEFVEAVAGAAGMAADLPTVEDQGQRIGYHPNHGQRDQGRALMDGGMFEMAVRGDGLKHLGIDAPSTAAELLDKRWRDGRRVRNWWRKS